MVRPTKKMQTGAKIALKLSKMTDDVIKRLEHVFAMDGTVGEACFYADISQATYYNWVKDNPELLERFQALRERPVLLARSTIYKSIQDNPQTAMWYLTKKQKAEFAEESRNLNLNVDVEIGDPEKLKKLAEILNNQLRPLNYERSGSIGSGAGDGDDSVVVD